MTVIYMLKVNLIVHRNLNVEGISNMVLDHLAKFHSENIGLLTF